MITEDRSTTVAPCSSAWLRSSAGIHLRGQPEHRLAGSACRAATPRSSPMASTVPGRRLAAGDLDAERSGSRRSCGGRSRLSRVRTGGMTMPRSAAILRRSALTRSSRSPPAAGSTRSTRSAASTSSSGSTWISCGERLGRCPASGSVGAAPASAPPRRVLAAPVTRVEASSIRPPPTSEERQLGHARDQAQRRARPTPAIRSGMLLAGRAGATRSEPMSSVAGRRG